MLNVSRSQGSAYSLMLFLRQVILTKQQMNGLQAKSIHLSSVGHLHGQALGKDASSKASCSPGVP